MNKVYKGNYLLSKRAFTLIELLAVIVILAIIALIAVPIVLSIINNSKEESKVRTAELIAKETELAYTSYLFKNEQGDADNFCTYMTNEYFAMDKGEIEGTCSSNVATVKSGNDKYTVTYANGVAKITFEGSEEELAKVKIKGNSSGTSKTCEFVSEGSYGEEGQIGSKYHCDVDGNGTKDNYFYLLNNSAPYNLIMDRNLGSTVAWNSTGDNLNEPITAIEYLESQTSTWKVDVSLPTANQIAYASGNTTWDFANTEINSLYFDTKTDVEPSLAKGESNYAWLFDYTSWCESYGCNVAATTARGYWTSSVNVGTPSFAWHVDTCGKLYNYGVEGLISNSNDFGIRPVITISSFD